MAGGRVPDVLARRLDTTARSGGAHAIGGRIPASDRRSTIDAGDRFATSPPISPSGIYIPPFSVTGEEDLTVRDFPNARLSNVTGAALTVSRVTADVGIAPSGTAVAVEVYKGGLAFATVFVTAGSNFGETTVGASWGPGEVLTIGVSQVGSPDPGRGLTVQVVTG